MKRLVHQFLALPVFLSALYVGPSSADETTAPPRALSIGTQGAVQPSANLQAWYSVLKKESATLENQFRIRRTELKLKGDMIPKKLAFEVMIDPAQVLEQKETLTLSATGLTDADGNTSVSILSVAVPKGRFSILQDAAITYKHEWCDLTIGQFKIPVSMEGYGSSSRLIFPEIAMVSKFFGSKRDIGIRFAKSFPMFGYALGIFNGSGQNSADTDDAKDVALRLEGYPISGVTGAAVYYVTIGGDGKGPQTEKQRVEIDVRVEMAGAMFQGEFITGSDETKGVKSEPRGYYALAGYTISDFQPVIRFGQMNPNTDSTSKEVGATQIEAGVNYYIPGLKQHEAKIQLAGGQFSRGADPKTGGKKELQVTSAFQVAF